ncbi:hypothetical protein R3W88_033844 [Solanum pinnatisectum]|uniref:HMA domain-containing protein n=1 Tax=Solanum pinnatisectum TaxID=50273 RepID=A0AAV9K095_9SOLN|nr:hypothetical protein R3W88_033844 [Solanum pinnatisectum]
MEVCTLISFLISGCFDPICVEMVGIHEKRVRKCLSKLKGIKKVEVKGKIDKVVVMDYAHKNKILKAIRRSGAKSLQTFHVSVTIRIYIVDVVGTRELLLVPKRTLILADYKQKTNSSIHKLKTKLNSLNSNTQLIKCEQHLIEIFIVCKTTQKKVNTERHLNSIYL